MNTMSAFYSGTDDNDDKTKILITGVIGQLNNSTPAMVFRMNRFLDKVPLTVDQLFEKEETSQQVPKEWMDRIKFGTYGGGSRSGSFPSSYYGARTGYGGIYGNYGNDPEGVDDAYGGDYSKKAVNPPAGVQSRVDEAGDEGEGSNLVQYDWTPEEIATCITCIGDQFNKEVSEEKARTILNCAEEYGINGNLPDYTIEAYLETSSEKILVEGLYLDQQIDAASVTDEIGLFFLDRLKTYLSPDGTRMLIERLLDTSDASEADPHLEGRGSM